MADQQTNDRLDRMDTEIRRLHGRASGIQTSVGKIDKCLAVVAENTKGLPALADRVREVEKTSAVVKEKVDSAEKRAARATGIAVTVALAFIGWVVKVYAGS